MITGFDLVAEQIRVAAGLPLSFTQADVRLEGHAIECRINAEDPDRNFLPRRVLISRWDEPTGEGIRVDTHCYAGYTVPPYYDSLLGKLIAHAATREQAVERMRRALGELRVEGPATTAIFHDAVLGTRRLRERQRHDALGRRDLSAAAQGGLESRQGRRQAGREGCASCCRGEAMSQPELRYTDVSLTDGQSARWAGAMTTPMMLAAASRLAAARPAAIEVVSPATLRQCVARGENPWQRIELLRERCPDVALRASIALLTEHGRRGADVISTEVATLLPA